MAGFKKKPLDAVRVAEVQEAAADAPIVGDPRMAVPSPTTLQAVVNRVGSSQDSPSFEVGRTYDVSLAKIKSNPFNPRAIYAESAIAERAASMASGGQLQSALAYIDDDGELVFIDGEMRLRAARSLGWSTLRVEIRPKPVSDRKLYEDARAANVERSAQSPLDDAIKWKELIGQKIYPTQVALAKALNVGEDLVSRTLSLAQMPRRIITALSENPPLLSLKMLNAIREFWEVAGEEDTLELILEASKNGMGYRDVASRRKAAANPPLRRPRATKEKVTFRGAEGEFKSFEEGGRIELSLKGLTPEVAEEIRSKILALFRKE
jgi:ParB family transcriptional regulator, chromosome partitioning protein